MAVSEIVFFYASPDLHIAKDIIPKVQEELNPLSLWWDEGLRRDTWDQEVKDALNNARCVVVLWSSAAAEMSRASVMNELVEADKKGIPIVVASIDEAELRGPAETGEIVPLRHDNDVNQLCAVIFSTLSNGRQWVYPSKKQKLLFPKFVRSVSSHETLIAPVSALKALKLHPSTDPILISSFDVFTAKEERNEIELLISEIREKGTPIFLDSGNYEAFRKCENADDSTRIYRLNEEIDVTWDQKKHREILSKINADFAFQYDPTDNLNIATANSVASHAIEFYEGDLQYCGGTHVIPILHVPKNENNMPKFRTLPKIAKKVIEELDPIFLAVPERELGHGMVERARTLSKLRDTLNETGKYRHLHLLGTGNPLSIAILAQAGADSFDGLEWCRTVSNHNNGHLFHTQHFDFFSHQSAENPFQHPVVAGLLNDPDVPWHLKLLLHNLDFFDEWMKKLQFHLHRGTILPLLKKALTDNEIELLQQQLDGIIR